MTIEIPTRRNDDRLVDQMRPITITPGTMPNAEGSATIAVGNTTVICTASVDEQVPPWMRGTGKGWVTAEYSMLPRATTERTRREAAAGKQSGRTVEIQRLIGRSLRAAVDMETLGERQVLIDCDVIGADGGTRCASITGAYVALAIACEKLKNSHVISRSPIIAPVAAVSVGVVRGLPVLDLNYLEDSKADVDANVVMLGDQEFVEVQFTSERNAFGFETMQRMLQLAQQGIQELFAAQTAAIESGVKN